MRYLFHFFLICISINLIIFRHFPILYDIVLSGIIDSTSEFLSISRSAIFNYLLDIDFFPLELFR